MLKLFKFFPSFHRNGRRDLSPGRGRTQKIFSFNVATRSSVFMSLTNRSYLLPSPNYHTCLMQSQPNYRINGARTNSPISFTAHLGIIITTLLLIIIIIYPYIFSPLAQGILQRRSVSLIPFYRWGNRGRGHEVTCPKCPRSPVAEQSIKPATPVFQGLSNGPKCPSFCNWKMFGLRSPVILILYNI